MRKYGDLHSLIHSLDKLEKRHFRSQMELNLKNGKSNYLELFELIQAQERPDEAALHASITDPVLLANLPSIQYQLYNSIIKCMRWLNSTNAVEADLRGYNAEIGWLVRKGIIHEARKRISKARALAHKHQITLYQVKMDDWEKRILRIVGNKHQQDVAEIIRTSKANLETYLRETDYEHLLLSTREIVLRPSKSVDKEKELHAIREHPLMTGPPPPKEEFQNRRDYLEMSVRLAIHNRYLPYEASQATEELWDLWESNPEMRQLRPQEYFFDLYRRATATVRTEKTADLPLLLDRMKAIRFESEASQLEAELNIHQLECFYHMNYSFFEDAEPRFLQIQEWFSGHGHRFPDRFRIGFPYNFTSFYYQHGEFSKANRWLRQMMNDPGMKATPDTNDFARIMQIILQLELGEYDLVEYLLQSTYRYLQRQKGIIKFEKVILAYIRKSVRQSESKDFIHSFEELKAVLDEEVANPTGPLPSGMYEVIFWLESKIRKMPLSELMREKIAARPR